MAIGVIRGALERRVGWGAWLAVTLLFVAFLAVVLPAEAERSAQATGSTESPDSSFVYSPADLERVAEAYGDDGRAYYVRARFTFDVVWPLVYGSFLQVSLLLASRRTVFRRLPTVVVLLPSLTVLFDLLENTATALVMARWPTPTPLAAMLAPVFTATKWTLLSASFVLAAAGGAAGALAWLRARRG